MNYRDTYLAMEAKENGRFKAQGVNYHNLGDTGLTELKNNFANPDYVIKHKASDKIELIYPQLDYKKRTVYCIVILNTDTKHSKEKLDVHVMTTAYGKAKIEKYVETAIVEGRLIYSKEESLESDSYVRYEGYAKSDSSSTNRITRNEADVNKKYSFETDDEYLFAVESGDVETAQRLVDSAAEAAMKDSKIRDKSGKLVKVYHGSDSADFYEFDKARRGQTDSSMYGRGYYFAFDPDYSSDFGENVRAFYLDIKNPYYIDINAPASEIADFLKSKGVEVDFNYSNMISHFFAKNFGSQKFTDTLIDLGYDGVVVRTDEGENWETVAFHRNQMKLADPVTYDDEGNVIPLSERFSEKRDVRYSFGDEGINTDYSDLSKLDEESRKVYNDRGWAMGLFTNEDKALLSQRLGEIFHKGSKYVRTILGDGTVVLDLNNKLLLLSGDIENPVINCVLAINAINEADEEFVREDIKYELQCAKFNKESFTAFLRASQLIYGEKSVRTFDREDYQYIKGRVDTGDRASLPDYWQNYGYATSKQDRRGVSGQTQTGVSNTLLSKKSYSFGEEDLDFGLYLSEDSEVVYDKKKMNGKYQVGSGRIVAFTHDIPFINNTIAQTDESVNKKYSFGDEELHYKVHLSDKSERGKYLRNTARVTDEDALTAFTGLDQSTQNNFIEALKAIARKLKEWATKCLKGTEYHSIVINDADTLLSLAKQMRVEFTKAGQKNNTAQSGGAQYSFDKSVDSKKQKQDNKAITKNGGNDYGSENTKLLERGEISAVGGNYDPVWEQSESAQEIFRYLGIFRENKTQEKTGVRKTDSRWLSPNAFQQQIEKGFATGILRDLQGVILSGKDTIGRVLKKSQLIAIKAEILDSTYRTEKLAEFSAQELAKKQDNI